MTLGTFIGSTITTIHHLAKLTFCAHEVRGPFPVRLAPGNHHGAFCPYESDYFRYLLTMESYSICFCVYVWLLSCSIMSSRVTHVVVCVRILSPVLGWITFPWMDRSHFSYPFIHQWTLGWLPPFGSCEYCSHERRCVDTTIKTLLSILLGILPEWNCWIIW